MTLPWGLTFYLLIMFQAQKSKDRVYSEGLIGEIASWIFDNRRAKVFFHHVLFVNYEAYSHMFFLRVCVFLGSLSRVWLFRGGLGIDFILAGEIAWSFWNRAFSVFSDWDRFWQGMDFSMSFAHDVRTFISLLQGPAFWPCISCCWASCCVDFQVMKGDDWLQWSTTTSSAPSSTVFFIRKNNKANVFLSWPWA